MPVDLDEDLYKWLVAMKALPNQGKRNTNAKVQLSSASSVLLQNGTIVGRLIKTIIRNNRESSPSSLEHLKEGATPAAKSANWNLIWSCFPLLRMEFDTQIKQLILEGDNTMVVEVLRQLSEKYPADISKVEVAQGQPQTAPPKQQQSQIKEQKKKPGDQKNKPMKADAVDMTKLDQKKDPASADSSLEFLLLLLCQSLNLPPNEVLGLFTNQNKYLAHVIAKGLKGEFTQIIQFYTSLRDSYLPKMMSLFEQDPKSESFTLYALKPGLVSKNKEVVALTIDILGRLNIYEWFVGEGKCLLTFILGLRRHPDMAEEFADFLVNITQNNFTQFITKHYKPQFESVSQLLETSAELLRPLAESQAREQLDKSGVVSEWLQLALQNIQSEDKENLTTRLVCFRFITKLWVALPSYVEDDQQIYDRLLLTMKKDWPSRTFNEFASISIEMLNLLVALARQKNPAAKLIYNLLAIVLAQTINSEQHRMFLLHNFTHICRQFPNIPLGFLLENYANVSGMQVYDYEFLMSLAASANLDIKSAGIIGQVALKFFQESVVNSACSNVILKVVARFSRDMVDFSARTVKTLMALLYATEKNKKSAIEKPLPLYNNRKGVPSTKPPTNIQLEAEIVAAQQRAQIIELVKKLIMQNNEPINDKIRPYIVATSLQIKQFNKQGHKGLNALLSLYGNQKEIEQLHINQSRQRRASESSRMIASGEESQVMKESQRQKILTKVTAPLDVLKHLETLREQVVEKKKKLQKQQEAKILQEQRKKLQVKRDMEKVKFMKGFGGEAQLFEEGYWDRKLQKKTTQLEVIQMDLLEPRDLQFIDVILRRYHKVLRQLFLKYTTTGFTTKNATNFDQQAQRTETISHTELVRLQKDYKLFFLTDLAENQMLVRDVNVKVLKKRETQEFDFAGFEQFIVQFALVVFSRPHTVTIKTDGKVVSEKRELKSLMPAQILEVFFKYLRTVSEERGQNTILFDDPDSAYFNESEVIREFNKKLQQDPSYILPEGYKKVTDRAMTFQPKVKQKVCQGVPEKYTDCLEVLDDILFNALGFHTLELMSLKTTKCKARPNVFVNVGSKLLLEKSEKANPEKAALESANRMRDLISSAGDIKHYTSEKLMQKKNLTLGMKLGLSQIPYKYKLMGQQVAYVLDDMLLAVEQGRTTIEKPKVVNEAMKQRQKQQEQQRRMEDLRNKKREQRIKELSSMKLTSKNQPQKPDEKELKKKKDAQRQKKKQQEMDKYLAEQKAKIQAKKKQEDQQLKKKEDDEKNKKKKQQEEAKKKFEDFNIKQIEKFKAELKAKHDVEQNKKKKDQQQAKVKEEKLKKLKSRIHQEDQKINQTKQKINEQLTELYNSPGVQELLKRHDYVLRALFDFLIKSTFVSITDRKHNNEVIYETWVFFNLGFKLSPAILNYKETMMVFQSLTRNKHQTKDYFVGLDYSQFCQALLREAVKHKSVFNKLSAKIKDGKLQGADVSEVLKGQDKNEFEQPKEMDINGLLKQDDMKDGKLLDNYGDISKADQSTLRGLIYYLKLPEDKNQLQLRFRNVLEQSNKRRKTKKQELKEKLNDDYSSLGKSPKPKVKKPRASSNQPKDPANSSVQVANEGEAAAEQG